MNYYNPWHGVIPPTPQPCHTCGHCPTCGRGGVGVNPFNPSFPNLWSTTGTGTGNPFASTTNTFTIPTQGTSPTPKPTN